MIYTHPILYKLVHYIANRDSHHDMKYDSKVYYKNITVYGCNKLIS